MGQQQFEPKPTPWPPRVSRTSQLCAPPRRAVFRGGRFARGRGLLCSRGQCGTPCAPLPTPADANGSASTGFTM